MPLDWKRRQIHRRRGHYKRYRKIKLSKRLQSKQKKKIGLNNRLTISNAHQIAKIKKQVETKVAEDIEANAASNFEGNYVINLQADKDGAFVGGGTASAWNLLACKAYKAVNPGTTNINQDVDGRIGRWITMKSLTMKYALRADYNNDGNSNQRVWLYIVHDSQPDLATPTIGDFLHSQATTTPPLTTFGLSEKALSFQNLEETGKKGRFKLVWKQMHILTPGEANAANRFINAVVPAIQPAAPPATYGSSRPTYNVTSNYSKSYPNHVYGSITIKKPYKLNYGNDNRETCPVNQSLFLMMHSEDPQTAANLTAYCRFRYKDA